MTTSITTYEQAIEFLYGRINYERVAASGYSSRDFKLDRMRRFLELLGNPQDRLPVVHVAGTKGKGSTSVMIAAMFQAAGYRVGLFTSPHISAFEERMKVGGIQPQPDELTDLVNRVLDPIARLDSEPGQMSPTYFEIATALAWIYFMDRSAEIAVLEVGLGGRLDATNLCRPEVTAITSISLDHTAVLGNTEEEIAREKAGIIKQGVPIVSGVLNDGARTVIAEIAARQEAPLIQAGRDFSFRILSDVRAVDGPMGCFPTGSDVEIRTSKRSWFCVKVPLAGRHQAANAALALQVMEELVGRGWSLPEECVPRGIEGVRWPVRIETIALQPTVIVDAAHNWAATKALVDTLNTVSLPSAGRKILVFSGTQDKDVEGLLRLLLPQFDTVILTQYQTNPRAVPLPQLVEMAEGISDHSFYKADDPAAVWRAVKLLAKPEDLVCITGSFFIATEMRELVLEERQLPEITAARGTAHELR